MEQSLNRNFLKSETENPVVDAVLTCLRNQTPGEDILENLNQLVRQEGNSVCKIILELLMHRSFGCGEAAHYWQEIVDHHRAMSCSLGRVVTISVAVCDYFSLHDTWGSFPKLIDVHEFEAMHMERQFDFLTGLHNKQSLESALNQEFKRAERYHHELSVLFLDLDCFKEINDRHGHLAGDRILRHVGRIIAQNKRSIDIAARFGGDEFVLLLPDTDKQKALEMAERIRSEISKECLVVENRQVRLTVSGGIATYPEDAASGMQVFRYADNALYQAKYSGKNIILHHVPEKRRSKRVEILAPLAITQIDSKPFSLAPMQSKNLGCTGILLESSVPIDTGSQLELEIILANKKLTIQGEVVRLEKLGRESFDIGVSFLKTQGDSIATIRDYLQ
ncbi:diguanylate cyclase [Thiovibrio sp. JS02]